MPLQKIKLLVVLLVQYLHPIKRVVVTQRRRFVR